MGAVSDALVDHNDAAPQSQVNAQEKIHANSE